MSFDAREPGSVFDPHAMRPSFAHAKVPPEMVGLVGETFASALYRLGVQIGRAQTLSGDAQSSALAAVREETERLEHLGVQVQQVARVLAGEGMAAFEAIDLASAARQTVAAWAGAAARRGVVLFCTVEPMAIEAIPGVVEQLLDLALEHALRTGNRVDVEAAMQGQPPRPMLTLHIEGAPADGSDAGAGDIHWQLLALLARASGLAPQRLVVGRTVTLLLGFAPPSPDAARAAPSAAAVPRTPIGVGRHVLLLEPRDITRLHAHRLMQAAGMNVDATVSVEQAHGVLRDRAPDVLVTGVPSDDVRCASLIDALRAVQPRLRVIELVDDDSAFALSLPIAGQAGRVGRRDLARTLVPAISQELDAAWALTD